MNKIDTCMSKKTLPFRCDEIGIWEWEWERNEQIIKGGLSEKTTPSRERGQHLKETQNNPALILFGIRCSREKLRGFQDSVILFCNNEEHFRNLFCQAFFMPLPTLKG